MSNSDYDDAYDSFEELYGRKPDATEKHDLQQQVNHDLGIKKEPFSERHTKNLKELGRSISRHKGEKIRAPLGTSSPKKKSEIEEHSVYDSLKKEEWGGRTYPPKSAKKGIPKGMGGDAKVTGSTGFRDVYYNPKTNKTWVKGLSGPRPSDSKNFIAVEDRKSRATIEQRELEKYYEQKKKQKSIDKAKSTRARNRRIQWWKGKKDTAIKAKDKTIDVGKAGVEKGKIAGAKAKGAGKWTWGKGKKAGATTRRIAWTDRVAADRRRKHLAQPTSGISGAARYGGQKLSSFGYALPGPFAVFTLAWTKMTKALKLLTVLAFALAILFIPWGVFYYTGWAVAAAFMFLVSLIFWVFISLFNGIAFVIVSFINFVMSAIMGAIIFIAEFILTPLMGVTAINQNGDGYYKWVAGRELFANALIKYGDIAAVPSLMHVVEPTWTSWMNDTLLGHLLGLFGVSLDFSWLTAPFRNFYSGLDATQAVVIGCIIIAIPIGFLIYVYYKNRHHMY